MIAIAKKKLDAEKYGHLLSETLPRAIKTEADYKRMDALLDRLLAKPEEGLTVEESALLDLVSTLIESYEDEHHPIPDAPPSEVLRFLMGQKGIGQADLIPVFGSRGRVSEAVNRKREISKAQARGLASFFKVSVELFI